uniref:mitogen-activated protein kinase kinase n=1 Tax=Heligmosomoides polygyrus TaxID=6339 RepID=A0A183FYQ4_HELPZ
LEFLAELGHGSCGHVSKMRYDDNVMAVKSMPRSSNPVESKRIIMDLRILSRAYDCPHIVHSYGYIITENEVMICMEAMATCLDLLLKRTGNKPIPEEIVGKMSVSVVRALDYLKENHNVIHRDVKPSNILLDWNGVVKLCDFGISGFLIESRAKSKLAGCPPYMAPERVRSTNTPYDIRSDVWSLGITLVELATGHFPYEGSDFQIISSILELPSPSLKDGFSEEFCELVDLCLRRNVEERPRYATILRHPFIVKNEQANTDVSEWFGDIMT